MFKHILRCMEGSSSIQRKKADTIEIRSPECHLATTFAGLQTWTKIPGALENVSHLKVKKVNVFLFCCFTLTLKKI